MRKFQQQRCLTSFLFSDLVKVICYVIWQCDQLCYPWSFNKVGHTPRPCVHGRPGEWKGRGLCPVGMCRKDSVHRMRDRRRDQERIHQGRNLKLDKKHRAICNSGRYWGQWAFRRGGAGSRHSTGLPTGRKAFVLEKWEALGSQQLARKTHYSSLRGNEAGEGGREKRSRGRYKNKVLSHFLLFHVSEGKAGYFCLQKGRMSDSGINIQIFFQLRQRVKQFPRDLGLFFNCLSLN